jgi:hypothetical protein
VRDTTELENVTDSTVLERPVNSFAGELLDRQFLLLPAEPAPFAFNDWNTSITKSCFSRRFAS